MKNAQASLFEFANDEASQRRYGRGFRGRTTHGGLTDKTGKKFGRKNERPISTKHSIHIVLKSDKAKGKYSFLSFKNKPEVKRIVDRQSQKFGVKIQDYGNVGNHIHIKAKTKSRLGLQKFLKSTTSLIARKVTGAKKGKPFGRFWQGLAYTRVLTSRKEELVLKGYIEANRREALGCNRTEALRKREEYLKAFNQWVRRITAGQKLEPPL